MIDLGQESMKMGEPIQACCNSQDTVRYPHFYIEGSKDLELPKSGTATIKFRLISETEEHRKDKESYRYELEVVAIGDVKSGGSSRSSTKDTEDALDALAKEAEDEDEED